MSSTIAIATNLHHRIELGFFEQWLDYHLRLGVDHVFLGIDVRHSVGDLASQRAVTGELTRPPRQYMWWKKPNFDYHAALGHAQILDRWREGLARFPADRVTPVFLRLPDNVNIRRQLRWLSIVYADYADRFDYLFFIDGDELLVPQASDDIHSVLDALEGDTLVYGIRQQLFDKRWASPGVNRESVFDIHLTRGVTDHDNPPPAHAFKCLFAPGYQGLDRADLHPHSFCGDFPEHYALIDESALLLHHFRGWEDIAHRARDEDEEVEVFTSHRHAELFARCHGRWRTEEEAGVSEIREIGPD
ncbi:MAG: hypothetical protein AAF184_17650 [Pseudomonadota bacterium]